jgi:hypothetical protein
VASASPSEYVTGFRFANRPLFVDKSWPIGTVIASVHIAERGEEERLAYPVSGGMWSSRALRHRYQVARTDLKGIWVRVSPEKMSVAECESMVSWRPGGFRIELVKTGEIHDGELLSVNDPLEFRVYGTRKGYRTLLIRERLRYDGGLKVKVVSEDEMSGRNKSRSGVNA